MAEHAGQEALLAGGVDEPAGGEGRGVEGAEAGEGDGDGEAEGAQGAEDGGAELHRDRVRRGDGRGGEDEDVGDVGEEVGQDDERHRGVDDAGEVARGADELADDVVGLFGKGDWLVKGFLEGFDWRVRIRKRGVYVIPAVESPQPSIQRDGPAREVGAGAGEPVFAFPLRGNIALVGEAGGCNHDADDGDAQESDEFEDHEHIPHASPQSCGNAVQCRNEHEAP